MIDIIRCSECLYNPVSSKGEICEECKKAEEFLEEIRKSLISDSEKKEK